MKKSSLESFVRIRNKSGFSSNLQFGFDLADAGLTLDDIGDAKRREQGGYEWHTEHGTLVEHTDGRMELLEPVKPD